MTRHSYLAISCGVLVLMLIIGAVVTEKANRYDREREETLLDLQAQRVARHIDAWKPQYEPYFLRFLNSERSQMRVLLYDLSGWEIGRPKGTLPTIPLNEFPVRFTGLKELRPLHGETPLPTYTNIPSELATEKRLRNRLFATNVIGATWVSVMPTRTGESWLVATTSVNDYDDKTKRSFVSAWIQAAIPLAAVERPARDRWLLYLGFALVGTGLLASAIWWSQRQSRSLKTAAFVAEHLPLDRLATTRLPEPPGDSESQRLVRACNRLLEKVAEAHLAQQRFVADAAHELRTPLTILRGEIQVALREPANHPFLIETLRSNLDEAVHLSRLVDSLLTLVRADAGQKLVTREPLELAPLIRSSIAKLESLAEESRVRLEFEAGAGTEDAVIQGDAIAMDRIVRNLLENAVKHSPANDVVRVTLAALDKSIHLSVRDRGIGIPPEHLAKLFDRFYRVDAARRRTDGGTGLGLAIVKTLVEAQGGAVRVQSEIGVGSIFTVELPRVTDGAASLNGFKVGLTGV
jgi:signal transduction histidine kinase